MTEKPPDYTTMSGAEFQRAVGADPAKWAAAFVQRYGSTTVGDAAAELEDWLADAMDAARKDSIRRVLGEGD